MSKNKVEELSDCDTLQLNIYLNCSYLSYQYFIYYCILSKTPSFKNDEYEMQCECDECFYDVLRSRIITMYRIP